MKLDLTGEWLFKNVKHDEWLPATVPGCNYLDLLELGLIPDPFYGTNEKDVYWVGLDDWEYRKNFHVSIDELKSDSIKLVCEMLDTICDVYVNDVLVGKGENTHLEYRFEIKPFIKPGENSIRIVFYSPVRYVQQKKKNEKCPKNWNGLDGIPHIRKPQCHFGWDWGPVLPPSGISRNIFIEFINTARIQEIRISQIHTANRVTLNISALIENFYETDIVYDLSVKTPNGVGMIRTGVCKHSILENVDIDEPEYWWTNDLSNKSEQPLYTMTATIKSNGEIIDEIKKVLGLRTITLNRERDQYGSNFQFILNGVPIFIKGANWIPADTFINRFDKEKLKYSIDAALFSNMNMLRVWGGGYYESDEFYALCDRYGILIWQDFAYACQPYPFFDEAFLVNVMRETAYNVKRLRHHACLAVWCGNNEIEALSAAWVFDRKYTQWTERFFYHMLEPEIRKHDKTTAYIPGSPCGVAHKAGYDKDNVGDTHLWAVWHGLQPMNYYCKRMTRFCSEFGFESLPDIKTIERFAKPKDLLHGQLVCMCVYIMSKLQEEGRQKKVKQFVDAIGLSIKPDDVGLNYEEVETALRLVNSFAVEKNLSYSILNEKKVDNNFIVDIIRELKSF